MLVDIFASQQQPGKIVPEMNSKDLLKRKAISSEPGNDAEVFAIISFFLNGHRDDRDRGEGLANDLPDWKVINSVECENTFPPPQGESVME